jgi:large subunit ribosomal protein L21
MFAIIQMSGRQARVSPGGIVRVDGTVAEKGTTVTLDQVLLVEKDGGEVLAGAPYVVNARVVGIVEGEARGPKIRVFKKKRRKGMRRTKGHRAVYTRVRVTDILI